MRTFQVTVRLRAPFLPRATAIGGYGIDTPVARDPDGQPYIPGSHLQGKLLEAMRQLAPLRPDPDDAKAEIDAWFGQEAGDPGDARRKRVILGDLRLDPEKTEPRPKPQAELRTARSRTRIAIDTAAGTALEGALQSIETPFPAGTEVTFRGSLRILAEPDEALRVRDAIAPAVRWIAQIGGGRSVGFGRVIAAELAENPETAKPQFVAEDKMQARRWRLELNFLEPFCIARPAPERNLYASEEVVPGGVFKGALASLMATEAGQPGAKAHELAATFPALARQFSALRVSHLFPARAGAGVGRGGWFLDPGGGAAPPSATRPKVAPLSLVQLPNGLIFDVARQEGPGRIAGALPAFRGDWKRPEALGRYFPWERPERELRVRTRIDPAKRAAATDQLFAYELIQPQGFFWLGELDLGPETEGIQREAVIGELLNLLEFGLPGIGKTLATAELRLFPLEEPGEPPPSLLQDGKVALTLQTPALLCRAEDLREGAKGLRAAYSRAFEELSCRSLRLLRFFADQRLAGGPHYRHRYLKDTYRPWVLTEAGSVFVFEVVKGKEEKAKNWLWQAALRGLGLAPDLLGKLGLGAVPETELFLHLPFLPENGYGEVALDLDRSHPELDPGRFFDVEPLEKEPAI